MTAHRQRRLEIALAAGLYAAFCLVVLLRPPVLLEPDDAAYRASIAALRHGDVTLTDAEYARLATQLGTSDDASSAPPGGPGRDPSADAADGPAAGPATGPGPSPRPGLGGTPGAGPGGTPGAGPGAGPGDGPGAGLGAGSGGAIVQWVRLPDGSWISEKNPGYPYLALPFAAVGLLRVAPLWYGALACIALFAGARRWLRPWAGLWAVGLFLASGAALVFAWRATMPTFTDAALVATGAGGLLWCLLARDLTARWRTAAGAAAFLALSLAVAARYTNVVPLIAATVVAAATFRRSGLSRWALAWWAAPVVLVGGFLALFDLRYYGTLTGTGYASGLITFSLSAVPDNLRILPPRLIVAMPATVLAVVALGWGAVRLVVVRGPAADPDRVWSVRADAVVGAALAGGWLGLWALYAAYDWTARMAMDSEVDAAVHLIRFYVPALGLVALLGAWVLARWPTWLSGVLLAVLAVAAVLSFGQLAADGPGRGGGPPPGGGPAPGIGPLPGGGPAPSGVPAPTGGPSPGGPPAGGAPPGG